MLYQCYNPTNSHCLPCSGCICAKYLDRKRI